MASSRKSKVSLNQSKRIAVALSGGLDSVVLLDQVCKSYQTQTKTPIKGSSEKSPEIWVFHIHHGLQKPADGWLIFCEKLAKKYRAQFDFRLLYLDKDGDQGNVEARARAGRYEALADLCAYHGIQDLLLAHHQNDQAETILLQLLRGAGVAGLSGMPEQRVLSSEGDEITLWRPLLDQSRVQLEAYAKTHKLKWIEDPSNQDMSYRRNAVRKQVIPRLAKIQPEAIANLARSAQLLGEAQSLLDRLAEQDGKKIVHGDLLKVDLLKDLAKKDFSAANNLLRFWLKTNELAMPSQERLESWWQDLEKVRADAQLEWQHDGACIRLWRDRLQIFKSPHADIAYGGRWVFKTVASSSKKPGISAAWVKQAQQEGAIEFRARQGSEKLQDKPNGPRKTLKNLFQEHGVPPWDRQAPLLYIQGELVAVAGVGVSYPHLRVSEKRIWPEWSEKF